MSGYATAPSTSAAPIAARSSGTTARTTVNDSASSRAWSPSPDASGRVPAALRSLHVSTSAVRRPGSAPLVIRSSSALLPPDAPRHPLAGLVPRLGSAVHGRRRPVPLAALAAGLREQPERADLDAPLDTLDHVVDRQRRHGRRRHRLHLDPRGARRRRLG